MIRKRILAGVLGLGLISGSAVALKAAGPGDADGRPGKGPLARLLMGRIGRGMELRSELNLTKEQEEAIHSTMAAHKQELAKAMAPVVDKGRALHEAVLADQTDDKAIHAAADDLGKVIGDAAVVIAKVKKEVKANAKLTDEQVKQIKEFRAKNEASVDKFLHQMMEK
jgi:Spy/CpxP family protein refolding chaperone